MGNPYIEQFKSGQISELTKKELKKDIKMTIDSLQKKGLIKLSHTNDSEIPAFEITPKGIKIFLHDLPKDYEKSVRYFMLE